MGCRRGGLVLGERGVWREAADPEHNRFSVDWGLNRPGGYRARSLRTPLIHREAEGGMRGDGRWAVGWGAVSEGDWMRGADEGAG